MTEESAADATGGAALPHNGFIVTLPAATAGSNTTVTNTYDEQGRLIDTVDANGAEASYSYDADGNLMQRDTATGPLSSSTNYDTKYVYDQADQLSSESYPNKTGDPNYTFNFYYDHDGNLRGTQYPTSTPTFSWVDTNPDGWITDQYNRHGTINGTTTPSTVPTDTSPLADFTYTYDQDGKRLSQSEVTGGGSPQATSYSYDNLGRLTQVVLPNGDCRTYNYDLDSNRTNTQEYDNSSCTDEQQLTWHR